MTDHVFTLHLSDVEMGQLEKLAAFEERDPADMLKALAIAGMAVARERRRSAEIMASGRTRRTPNGRGLPGRD